MNKLATDNFWDPFIEFTDTEMNFLSYGKDNLPRKGIFVRLLIYPLRLFRGLFSRRAGIKSRVKASESEIVKKVWVLSGSNTESQSLAFVGDIENISPIYIGLDSSRALQFMSYFFGIFSLPYIIIMYLYSDNSYKRLFAYLIDEMMHLNGLIFILSIYKYFSCPQYIIYANHVSPLCRAVINLFKKDSKTLKIFNEHVPMISYWPPVNADIFFLSGQFSLNNMLQRTSVVDKRVYLVGPSRNEELSSFCSKSKNDYLKVVGIAVVPIDRVSIVIEFLEKATAAYPSIKFIVRPHSSLRIAELTKALKVFGENVELHPPKLMSISQFFDRIDLLIFNDSGIFFESIVAEVPILRLKFSNVESNIYGIPAAYDEFYDSLDFAASNLRDIPLEQDSKILKKILFGNLNTKYWMKSKALKAEIISGIINGELDEAYNQFGYIENN